MPTTPVKWKMGYANHIKHTPLTGYKSKTVSQEIRDLAAYYRYNCSSDFGHALESYCKNREPRLRHNIIERIKFHYWSWNPELEYFQLTEEIVKYDKELFDDEFYHFLMECASSPLQNDVPLTTSVTNDNIGFV